MTLYDVRQIFVQRSGRYDLIIDTVSWADNGADYFINEGSKILDRSQNINSSISRTYTLPTDGQMHVLVDNMIACERVFVHGGGQRTELEKLEYVDMVADITGTLDSLTKDRPVRFCIGHLRSENPNFMDVFGQYFDFTQVDPYHDVIFIYPPTTGDYNIEVWGLYHNNLLINDTDRNVWTENHQELLAWAALYAHEVSRRNTSGANDWWQAISAELNKLDDAMVYEMIVDQNRIRDI